MTDTKLKTAPSAWRPFNRTGLLRIPGRKKNNKNTLKIGTWNARILYETGRLKNVFFETKNTTYKYWEYAKQDGQTQPLFTHTTSKSTHPAHEMDVTKME